jgi:hypothetical protein
MNGRFVLMVSLWLKDVDVTRLEAFERDAALRMAKYDGRFERAIRMNENGIGAGHPLEIHVVSFPDESTLRAYQEERLVNWRPFEMKSLFRESRAGSRPAADEPHVFAI